MDTNALVHTDPRLPGADELATLGIGRQMASPGSSTTRFPDGGSYRIEIPSLEGPEVMRAALDEAKRCGVTIHRISQGSGVMMLQDAEIIEMLDLAREENIEVCLFLGPRALWDIGAGRATTGAGPRARGYDQLGQSIAEAQRAVNLGVRCLLVADEGVLWTLHRMRREGDIPADLRLKFSALTGPSNPASFQVISGLGADSINVPGDMTISHLAELRRAMETVIDIYIESPDDLGGFVRHYEVAEIIRVAAPVYLKFGVRNAPPMYPVGQHLISTAKNLARERVRRARLCLDHLDRIGSTEAMPAPGNTELRSPQRFALQPDS
ncbi:hypothetical protein [Nesterenkonia muleiensis]|uniref:hypothetical protein n=1 Tax=Nesterenkonia muleiensis TaxID=2282648 RepID=UPI0013003FD9|nr:hypothetical protein [Nesterenkonia muleiensis]